MNHYHIAYFIPAETPTLSGITVRAESIIEAYKQFLFETDYKIAESNIKYIIKL